MRCVEVCHSSSLEITGGGSWSDVRASKGARNSWISPRNNRSRATLGWHSRFWRLLTLALLSSLGRWGWRGFPVRVPACSTRRRLERAAARLSTPANWTYVGSRARSRVPGFSVHGPLASIPRIIKVYRTDVSPRERAPRMKGSDQPPNRTRSAPVLGCGLRLALLPHKKTSAVELMSVLTAETATEVKRRSAARR